MTQTAEELLANNIDALRDFINDDDIYYFYRGVICEFAKGFAEIHVTKALKGAELKCITQSDSIIDCYPLTNIK